MDIEIDIDVDKGKDIDTNAEIWIQYSPESAVPHRHAQDGIETEALSRLPLAWDLAESGPTRRWPAICCGPPYEPYYV